MSLSNVDFTEFVSGFIQNIITKSESAWKLEVETFLPQPMHGNRWFSIGPSSLPCHHIYTNTDINVDVENRDRRSMIVIRSMVWFTEEMNRTCTLCYTSDRMPSCQPMYVCVNKKYRNSLFLCWLNKRYAESYRFRI